jgi:hypothetical protein
MRTSSRALWITVALAAGVLLLVLMFWDYLWVNLIHSGSVDAP